MENFEPVYGTGPLLGIAAGAIALLLFLIIRFKLHAFIALVLVSVLTALAAGIPVAGVMPTLLDGFGGTLASVALLVGLGVMIGRLLEITGGAAVLASALIKLFGEKRAPLALGVASLLFGFPIFFDVGLVVMLPIVFSVARRVGGSVLLYALPTAGAFAVMHAFVPPHPGPVTAAVEIGADMGLTLLVGTILAIPTWYLASYLFGLWAGKRWELPVPDDIMSDGEVKHENPPHLMTVISILLLPMLLIFANTGMTTVAAIGAVAEEALWVEVMRLLGETPIALLITVIYAMVVLSKGRFTRTRVEEIVGGHSARSAPSFSSPAPAACSAGSCAPAVSVTPSPTAWSPRACRSSSRRSSSPWPCASPRVRPPSPSPPRPASSPRPCRPLRG